MNLSKIVCVFFIALLFFGACTSRNEALRGAVLEEYRRLRHEFETTQKEACRDAIIARAEASVDSIILRLNIDPLQDTLYNPVLPEKPRFIPVDSMVWSGSGKSGSHQ